MVYVISIEGKPLMPCTEAKARKLLKSKRAEVFKKEPFTIKLLFACENVTQDTVLGVDAGSKHIGLSVTTNKKELYSADVELRNDIVDLLSTRSQNRRARRNRLRYRKPRFNNRTHSKKKGWLAPSVSQKIQTHLKAIEDVHKILPVTKIIVETASFDIQRIKNLEIKGKEYRQGEQTDFWNVREYVLFRDGHTCQCCKGKSGDKVLNVHHIESRKTGGNAPNNLITLCKYCHKGFHNGTIELPETIKRGMRFSDAVFMNIMRQYLLDGLKNRYPNVENTYGYITKDVRIRSGLPKEHYIDARCITGNPNVEPLGYYFYQKKVRCHNRQMHKAKILKGDRKKRNQAEYIVKGFRLYDKVKYGRKTCFVFGRRSNGYFDIRTLSGEKISAGVSYKNLKLIYPKRNILTERINQGNLSE